MPLLALAVFTILFLAALYFFRGSLAHYLPTRQSNRSASIGLKTPLTDEGFSSPAQSAVDDLAMELDDLHWILNHKKKELQQLKREQVLQGEVAMKLHGIEDTIDTIETRLQKLQSNLANVRQTAVRLDELGVALQQSQESLSQKQQALQATGTQNSELRQQVEELQAYAVDLKKQRQLLQQRIRLLEDLHSPS
jgi:chromosome segregation ATPase